MVRVRRSGGDFGDRKASVLAVAFVLLCVFVGVAWQHRWGGGI